MAQATLLSPIGTILIECDEHCVLSVRIVPDHPVSHDTASTALGREALQQFAAYFDGTLTDFDLPIHPLVSPRGEALREAIRAIPYGSRLSYGGVARTIDSGPRAVGQACRRNPLPIIIPCHRVTASGGGLGYYSAGTGVDTKLWLLEHEAGGQ